MFMSVFLHKVVHKTNHLTGRILRRIDSFQMMLSKRDEHTKLKIKFLSGLDGIRRNVVNQLDEVISHQKVSRFFSSQVFWSVHG